VFVAAAESGGRAGALASQHHGAHRADRGEKPCVDMQTGYPAKAMTRTTLFKSNRSQVVRLPKNVAFRLTCVRSPFFATASVA